MRILALVLIVAGAGLISVVSLAAGDIHDGKRTYAACAGCHGGSGAGSQVVNAPRIAGLDSVYLARQLDYFRKGLRGATKADARGAPMAMVSKALDADGIANVVAYIATLQPAAAKPVVEGDSAQGKALYGACTACHGAAGEGNPALNAPRLAGGSDWYMVEQLRSYKAGIRGSHADDVFGKQMAPMAAALADDKAIRDVVAYINTL